jgi:hypothetical protein
VIRRVWIRRACWSAIVLAGLAIKSLQSPLYIFGSADDDELMVRMAKGFLEGHWSSSWSSTGIATLVKPVGFPIFLAAAHFLPWSPLMTIYLLYLLGALLISWSWRRLSGSWPQATIVLAALTFNPIEFTLENQRIYRDIFICAVATVAIGLAFVVAAQVSSRHIDDDPAQSDPPVAGTNRRHSSGKLAVLGRCLPYALAVLIGLAIGEVAITKPTWYWLPVAILAPLAYPLIKPIHTNRHGLGMFLRAALCGLLAIASVYGVIETTKLMNKRKYGVALVEGFSAGGLARTWKAWASVEAGSPRKDVQITEAMRLAVYRVSPTAAEMKPYLESPTDPWKAVDCASSLHICNESGNWFEWDLQYAAVSTGTIHSVLESQEFFNKVADEIEKGCSTGELRCTSSPVLATGLPPLNQISTRVWASDTTDAMWQMLDASLPMEAPNGPQPSAAQYRLWSSVVPGMTSLKNVSAGTSPAWLYSMLRLLDFLYRIFSVLLLITLCLGPLSWVLYRVLRRPRKRNPAITRAAVASGLFLISWGAGMGLLAVFEAGRGWNGYVTPLYWTDFATPAELFLLFGAFAAWPLLKSGPGMLRIGKEPAGMSGNNAIENR